MTSQFFRYLLTFVLAFGLASSVHAEMRNPNHTATWWDENDPGWGVSTLDQGNGIGPYWFTYDEQNRPTWFMGLALPQPDGSFSGDLYSFTGTPFQDIRDIQSNKPATIVGSVKLDFAADPHNMRFTTTIDGATVSRDVTRFNFNGKDVVCKAVPSASPAMTNYSEMWWEPATTGWGIILLHLDQQIYAQWYTYETPDRAVFMTMGLERQIDGSYTGTIYRQRDGGRAFKSGTNASSQPGSDALGTASLIFLDGTRAEFDYVVGDQQGHHVLQRFQMGALANECEVVPYEVDGGGNPADGELCWPEYAINDTRTLRDIGTSDGVPADPFVFKETVTGTASFNGQSGFRITYTSAAYAGNGTYAYSYVGNGAGTTASFGAEALDPATQQLISTSKNDPTRVELTRRFQLDETIALDYGVNSTSAAGNTRSDLKTTYRLVGRENVTVPAGTFSACKIETTIDFRSTMAGISTHTLRSGFLWSDANFGLVKQESQITSTVNAFGYTITTEGTDKQELLEATMQGNHRP